MSVRWDQVSYIKSSKYRQGVAERLYREGPSTPSELAEATGYSLPHVSRALTQLRDADVVELLVSEERHRGRLYGMTDDGTEATEQLLREDWMPGVEVRPLGELPRPELVEYLSEEVGDDLRAVTVLSDERAVMGFADEALRAEYDESTLRSMTGEVLLSNGRLELETRETYLGPRRFTVHGFDRASVVHLHASDGIDVKVSLDPDADIALRSFVDGCFERLDRD